ncbi:MAG: trimethylamine methyltransferase family protein [Phycisphaerae bacterium]|nr:trimethylamine methyltransferase family protein [Phycisphaerae bacterium]
MRSAYRIEGGLSEEQLERIHETALRILDEIGLHVHSREVPDEQIRDRLLSRDGVRLTDGRLCFAPTLVTRLLAAYQQEVRRRDRERDGELTIRTVSHAFHVLDAQTDTLRPCSTADLVEFTRLTNTYYDEGLRGACPGFPQDVPPPLQGIAQYMIGCRYSRTPPAPTISSNAAADFVYEMAEIMGYASQASYVVGVHPVSPLRLEGDEFEIALHLWRRLGDKLAVSTGPMPIVGVSAPIHLPGAMAQAVAEALGCFVFFKLLTGGKVDFWFNFYAFDMRHGSFAYGGPEDALIALMRKQMSQWYGLPSSFGDKALNTMSQAVDAQAAAEKASKTVMALLAGADLLAGAGGLSLDESFSPEQLVVDVEIVRWAKRAARGFEFDDAALAFDVIREAVARGGDFLSHETTLLHHSDTYWMPELFLHQMKRQWEESGGRTVRQRAGDIVRQRLASEGFEIACDRTRELERIYRAAEAALVR